MSSVKTELTSHSSRTLYSRDSCYLYSEEIEHVKPFLTDLLQISVHMVFKVKHKPWIFYQIEKTKVH